MSRQDPAWQPFCWHCPNCGAISRACKDREGVMKAECGKCRAVTVRKAMGRRHDRLDVYAPRGEAHTGGGEAAGMEDAAVTL